MIKTQSLGLVSLFQSDHEHINKQKAMISVKGNHSKLPKDSLEFN